MLVLRPHQDISYLWEYYGGNYNKYDKMFIVFNTLLYLYILAPICYLLITLDYLLINTDSELVRDFYDRYSVYTEWISVGNMLYQIIVYIFAWVFVRRVNQRDTRPTMEIL
jgi:hypothetical protein